MFMRKFRIWLKSRRTVHDRNSFENLQTQGNRHLANSELHAAIECYRRAAEIQPNQSGIYIALGYALKESGADNLALTAFGTALTLDPNNAEALYFLGNIALTRGDNQLAVRNMLLAINQDPMLEAAYCDAAAGLFKTGQIGKALALIDSGIEKMPLQAKLHFTKGNLFAEAMMYQEAAAAYHHTLWLEPGSAEALANLGNCERHLGLTNDALIHMNAALEIQPFNAAWHSTRLFTLQYSGTLGPADLFEQHLQFAKKFEHPLRPASDQIISKTKTQGRLRVGYVSGDFRQHSLSYFFEPVLRNHDRSRIEVFCYYTYPIADEVTERMRTASEHWRDCAALSDQDLFEKIKEDAIDILVDLSGHTGYNRLLVFARKPAPIQMTWLGYQSSTGLSTIDYRITDAAIDPPGKTEKFNSEKLLRLSRAGVFEPDPGSPQVTELPSKVSGIFTYACLNNPAKITSEFIAATATILRETVNTRLAFGNSNKELKSEFLQKFQKLGISQDRLIFFEKMPIKEYLAIHSQIDLALDTFPYNGGTTTLHSLWMGVPVLSVEGETAISRVGGESMKGLNLSFFACPTVAEYITKAIELSSRLEYMKETRGSLRLLMRNAVVEQCAGFTRELEHAFKTAHTPNN